MPWGQTVWTLWDVRRPKCVPKFPGRIFTSVGSKDKSSKVPKCVPKFLPGRIFLLRWTELFLTLKKKKRLPKKRVSRFLVVVQWCKLTQRRVKVSSMSPSSDDFPVGCLITSAIDGVLALHLYDPKTYEDVQRALLTPPEPLQTDAVVLVLGTRHVNNGFTYLVVLDKNSTIKYAHPLYAKRVL